MENTKVKKITYIICIPIIVIVICLITILNMCLGLANFSMWMQIITNVFVIISVIIAVITLRWFIKDYGAKHKYSKIDKSLQMAKFYKENILDNLTYICSIFNTTEIDKIINKIDYQSVKLFNKHELEGLFSEEDIKAFDKIFEKITEKNYLKFRGSLCKNYKESEKLLYLYVSSIKGGEEHAENVISKAALSLELNQILSNALNDLEYFSMHFVTKIADEKAVYQSLHQTFLINVKYLYYWIASRNKIASDQYFTNIIQLFNEWKDIDAKNKENEKSGYINTIRRSDCFE